VARVRGTGRPNGRPPSSLEGKSGVDVLMKAVPVDVIEKVDSLRQGAETRKDVIVRVLREYEGAADADAN
jgi:hypothetical protein